MYEPFEKTSLAWKKIKDWSKSDEEFVKRAAYALLACHDKKFIGLFPLIKHGSTDERNFVKKAVSWALRNIGKRNIFLNQAALEFAKEIGQIDNKTAKWISSDVIKDLNSSAVKRRIK